MNKPLPIIGLRFTSGPGQVLADDVAKRCSERLDNRGERVDRRSRRAASR